MAKPRIALLPLRSLLIAVLLALSPACSERAIDSTTRPAEGGAANPGASAGGSVTNAEKTGGAAAIGTGGATTGRATTAGACVAPPGKDFDPVAGYLPPVLVSTAVVSSPTDSGPGSLRAVVNAAAADAVITFDPSLAGTTITLASVIELTRSITLNAFNAPGLTLDGANATQLFHMNGDAPTRIALFNLRLIRGTTPGSGGAISLNGGALELEIGGCHFEQNSGSEGGAVRVGYGSGTKVYVHDSSFKDNDGSLPGTGNGFSGGAISATGGQVRVVNTRFEGNRGYATGGLYTIHSNPIVEDSVFLNNRTSRTNGGSGAFFADGGGPGDYNTNYNDPNNQIPGEITLRRTRFEGNHGAGDDGGAVEAYAYPLDTVTFDGCVFRDNVAAPGRAGAAFIHADKVVNILQTAFVNNHATAPGGAIWADGSALYRIENSLFSGNVSDGDLGGALRLNISDTAELQIQSSTFSDNVTQNGNGALWLGGQRNAHVANSIFVNNTGSSGSQQINFTVMDDGGNLLWPDVGGSPTLPGALLADPLLGPLKLAGTLEIRVPQQGSPAINAAKSPAPISDQRGGARNNTPDSGAIEVGATCAQ